MKQIPLGSSDIMVSDWCLGTMTFGTHTSVADSGRQIDMCLDAGINFLDTAEMYPVNPVAAETVGQSEEAIGAWVAASGRRDAVVIATKVSGANGGFVRGGAGFNGGNIAQAVDDSLRRLNTDVIDLYQLHWPDRGSYMFRQNWTYDPSGQDRTATLDHMDSVLGAMQAQIDAGKVRAFGLSNESAWGTTRWIDRAAAVGGPRVVSVQNEYSLLCRLFDTDMAEMAVNEDVTLLSFSPLAAGLLTGKYQGGQVPTNSRMQFSPEMGGRKSVRVFDAVDAYLQVAHGHGLDPVHMTLAWQRSRPFPVGAIFGATTVAQLEHLLARRDLELDDAVLKALDAVHYAHPMPY